MNQITGKIVKIMPEKTGAGKNGQWRKKTVVIETIGDYPKKIAVQLWGDKCDTKLSVGQLVNINIGIESREYKDEWYTDIKIIRFNEIENQKSQPDPEQQSEPEQVKEEKVSDDLPF